MKRFEHTIQAPTGIHARVAFQIRRIARRFPDTAITVSGEEKTVRADKLLRLLSLGVRGGDRVTVTCTGDNEMAATVAMQSYFWNHL